MDNLEYLKLARELTGSTNVSALIEAARQISQYHMEAPGAIQVEEKVNWMNIRSLVDFASRQYIFHPVKGHIPFNPYDFQKDILKTLADTPESLVLVNNARQMGLSTLLACYALYEAVTKPNSTVLLLAPKYAGALDAIGKVRNLIDTSKVELPALDEYSRGSIRFNNGSKIIARAVSDDCARGTTIDLMVVFDAAFISYSKEQEFWNSVQPALAPSSKTILQSTPNYDQGLFYKMWSKTLIPSERIEVPWYLHNERDTAWETGTRSQMTAQAFTQQYECKFTSRV
jgi:hypothetical protein